MSIYYQDESVTLYHGDCLTETAWLEADVPYGRAWRQGQIGDHAKNHASGSGIANDKSTDIRDAALDEWGDKPAVIFGDLMLPPPSRNKLTCVYHKTDGAAGIRGAMGGVRRDVEAIYLTGKWPTGIGGRSSVFASARQITGSAGLVARSGGHPHAKDSRVMQSLVGLMAGVIADPFAGSGATLVAARNLGRKAIGVELEERYCEVIAKRLSQGVLDFGDAS